jgi:hypothetical protein
MNDVIRISQRGQRLGPQQSMRVGDHADENWLCGFQLLFRSIIRFISV